MVTGSGEENNSYAIVEVYDDQSIVAAVRKALVCKQVIQASLENNNITELAKANVLQAKTVSQFRLAFCNPPECF